MNPKSFLINLDRSEDRLSSVTRTLSEAGIAFSRISAVDGYAPNTSFSDIYDIDATRAFMGRSLLGGEVGCFLSHVRALNAFVATGDDYGFIFEDDAVILNGFNDIIDAAIKTRNSVSARDGWEVFSLCATNVKLSTPLHQVNSHTISKAHYFPMRCTGLLWTRDGATRFLTELERIDAPYDIYLRRWVLRHDNAIAVSPAIVTNAKVESDIEEGTARKRSEHHRYSFYTLKRLKRIFCEKKDAFYLKYIK